MVDLEFNERDSRNRRDKCESHDADELGDTPMGSNFEELL